MEYLSHPTFSACYRHGLALLCGLFWAAAAQANPPLYVCPGPLFTNDLAPAQAKARGCELAARGRLSQAQDSPLQAMAAADTEPRPALAATPPGPASTPASTPVSIPASTPALAPSLAPSSAPVSAPSSVTSMTAVSTASLPAASAASAASTAIATSAPTANAPRKGPEPAADASRQRQRDSHAREIVLAELARTQARIQALSAQPPAGPEAQSALQRLQRDEDALRRELARRPG